ncbi:MAG: DUF4294 domain-containing protein [Bacteroidales bacterium]
MSRIFTCTVVLFLLMQVAHTQERPDDSLTIEDIIILNQMFRDGDTLLHATIEEVYVYPVPQFSNRRDLRRYRRLVYNLKIVYPYAILAADKLDELNEVFVELETERERKRFVKQVESELKEEFEGELKSLTITQGRLLIKLIDRETGNTSYELVRELRGSFSAFFWQAIARLFGSNLKAEFDAEGEDKLIDQIVHLIENGQI